MTPTDYTIVHVTVEQFMVCGHKILLCDKAFTFPEEKHYSRQPLDDFQDMTTFVQPRNPAGLHFVPLIYCVAATQSAETI